MDLKYAVSFYMLKHGIILRNTNHILTYGIISHNMSHISTYWFILSQKYLMRTYGTILCYAHYEFIYNIWNHVAQYKCAWSICINKNVYVHYETRYRHIETYCALSSRLSTFEKILWYVDMYNYIVHYKSCANIRIHNARYS